MINTANKAALALVLGVLALLGYDQSSAANLSSSPQGDSWDSIKQLPDWSGVWMLHRDQAAIASAYGSSAMQLTPKYAELQAKARAARAQANMSTCLPAGATAILQHTILYEFLFTPGRVTMLFEDGEVRRIFTDGRAHRSLDELRTSFMGDSIGHWEGKTLVVDTIGFPNGELWENYGVRATKNTHLVERISLTDQGEIQIDNVMTDPEIFTQPYAYTRRYQRATLPLLEAACVQNNRDTGTEIDLTPPEA